MNKRIKIELETILSILAEVIIILLLYSMGFYLLYIWIGLPAGIR
ncbi:MAG: hypothetical protein ACD_86C00003G0006 [uncultured bacterium]|nr:MAG: hypothetical protein ACD_86C00003G0006 [uncultured bacterium]